MKAKTLSLMTLSILALVLIIGLTSATLTLNSISVNPSVDTSKGTFDLTFNLTNEDILPGATITWVDSVANNGGATFSSFSVDNLLAGETKTVTAKVNFDEGYVGAITGTIEANNSATESNTLPFSATIIGPTELSLCSLTGNKNNALELKIKNINVVSGYGEEDNEWVPLDEIEVEVEIKYEGNDKMSNIVVKWGLYNFDTKDWVFDEEENDFNLKDGDKKTLIFNFKLEDPEDFEDGENYAFFVWAEGEDEEYNDDLTCLATSEEISLFDGDIPSDFLVLSNFEIEGISLDEGKFYPGKLSCGSKLILTADLWNIGDSDQEDIEVRVYNSDFGIDEILEIGDVNSFDSEAISYEFTIPEGMEEGWNTLELTIQEDGDIFENDYVDSDAEFEVLFNLENCAFAQAFVSASLDDGGKAGRDLIVRVTITNTGTDATTYLVNAAGYAEWASTATVEPNTIILEAGQSEDVLIALDVNRDASGERLFNIEILSEGQLVISQPLSVSIEKALVGDLFGDNLATILVIGISVILVIIIIVLAIRVARK